MRLVVEAARRVVARFTLTDAPGRALRFFCGGGFADDDRHVRKTLALEVRAPLSTRIQAFGETATGAAIDRDARNVQLVGIHVVVVAGIGDGTAHEFLDRLRRVHAGELQHHERFAHTLAANRVGDATKLTRTHAHEFQMRNGLLRCLRISHYFTPALSPPWPRKLRVGANSPSL